MNRNQRIYMYLAIVIQITGQVKCLYEMEQFETEHEIDLLNTINGTMTEHQQNITTNLETGEPDTKSVKLQYDLRPTFLMNKIHIDECLELPTTYCTILNASRNCTNGIAFFTACSAEASNAEVQLFLSKIGNLNASRAVKVTVYGKREFKQETFQPVADDLIILNIMNYDNLELSTLKHLKLPWLTHLGVINSSNVVVDKDAFQLFPRLTMIVFERSTINFIFPKAFENLPYLRQLTLDAGLLSGDIRGKEYTKRHFRMLHCNCHYQWLRDFLERKPYLLKGRKAGEIHDWGGLLSPQIRRMDNGAPVDCRAADPIALNFIGEKFSLNVDC